MGSTTSLSSRRAESMRDGKKSKRTPSFTTRRRTQSFRKHKRLENLQNLPPVEIEGFLSRKQDQQSGGKRATVRTWKTYYTVLCGQLLAFYKDQNDFIDNKTSTGPMCIYNAVCEKIENYKKKHVFRLVISDKSTYLFSVDSEKELEDWVKKISFHARLPPNQQLSRYDDQQNKDGPMSLPEVSIANDRHDSYNVDDQPIYANIDNTVRSAQDPSHYSKPPVPLRVVTSPYDDRPTRFTMSGRPVEYNGVSSPNSGDPTLLRSRAYSNDHDVPPVPNTAPPTRGMENQQWRQDVIGPKHYTLPALPQQRQNEIYSQPYSTLEREDSQHKKQSKGMLKGLFKKRATHL